MRQSSIPNPLKLLKRRRINNLHTLAVLTNFFLFFFALPFSPQGAGQEKLGIYIKSVVKGGAADVVSPTTQGKKSRIVANVPRGRWRERCAAHIVHLCSRRTAAWLQVTSC